jgi:brefeldin A-inhibited guanine nucleotide-exchange protein
MSVGLSVNLFMLQYFVMDPSRQLAMEFLQGEVVANYDFLDEFLQPVYFWLVARLPFLL